MTEFLVAWCILGGALAFAAPVIFLVINNSNLNRSHPDLAGANSERNGSSKDQISEDAHSRNSPTKAASLSLVPKDLELPRSASKSLILPMHVSTR